MTNSSKQLKVHGQLHLIWRENLTLRLLRSPKSVTRGQYSGESLFDLIALKLYDVVDCILLCLII